MKNILDIEEITDNDITSISHEFAWNNMLEVLIKRRIE